MTAAKQQGQAQQPMQQAQDQQPQQPMQQAPIQGQAQQPMQQAQQPQQPMQQAPIQGQPQPVFQQPPQFQPPQQAQQPQPVFQHPPQVQLIGYDAAGNAMYGSPAMPSIDYTDTVKKMLYIVAGAVVGAVGYKIYQNRQNNRRHQQMLLAAPSVPQENMTYDTSR